MVKDIDNYYEEIDDPMKTGILPDVVKISIDEKTESNTISWESVNDERLRRQQRISALQTNL